MLRHLHCQNLSIIFRFYKHSQDGATIPEESYCRKSTIDTTGILIIENITSGPYSWKGVGGTPPLKTVQKSFTKGNSCRLFFLLWLKKQGCWWLFFQTLLTSSLSKGIHSNVVTKYDRHTFSPYIKIIINLSYRNNYFLNKHTKTFINIVVDNKKQ